MSPSSPPNHPQAPRPHVPGSDLVVMPQTRCGGKKDPILQLWGCICHYPSSEQDFCSHVPDLEGFSGLGEVFFEPPKGSGGAAVTSQPPSKRLPCSRETSCLWLSREATPPERQGGFSNPLFAPSHPQKRSEFVSLYPDFPEGVWGCLQRAWWQLFWEHHPRHTHSLHAPPP